MKYFQFPNKYVRKKELMKFMFSWNFKVTQTQNSRKRERIRIQTNKETNKRDPSQTFILYSLGTI